MNTRTLLLSLAVTVLAGGKMAALADTVYSDNVAGYFDKPLTGNGKYTCTGNPLNAPTNTLGAVLGWLPPGSKVLKWSGTSFIIYTRVPYGNGWNPPGGAMATCNLGEGFFVQTPVQSGGNLTEVYVGEVFQGYRTNNFPAGYTLIAGICGDSGPVNQPPMLLNPPNNSKINQWSGFSYTIYTKVAFGIGWIPTIPIINPAEGMFLNCASAYTWIRYYTVQ